MSKVTVAAFRYAPAIGGAENYTRRLLREIGERVDVNIVTLLTTQRTDWLRALIEGERDQVDSYAVDGRAVTALARWPFATRRALNLLAPGYHVPGSPSPWLMGRMLSRPFAGAAAATQVPPNILLGREALPAGLLQGAGNAGKPSG